jgi:Na+:H+ antiporter, NhaA family
VAGGAAVAGIGFTVPLLIAEQAFVEQPALVDAAELGLLAGSFAALAAGAVVLVSMGRRAPRTDDGGGTSEAGRRPIPW